MGVRTSFRQGLLCAAAIVTTMAMPADTLALEPAEFTIEAAPLGDALRAFSQQSGRAILFSEGTVSGLTAPRLTGTYEPEAALTLLLQGTGLEFTQGPNGNLIVRRQTGADPVQTPEPGRGRGREVSGEPDPEADSRRIETITVTGTSIRGIAPESSPLFVFDREEILSSGLTTTEQFIRNLPQNFGGGASEQASAGLPNDINSQANTFFGSGANLRGLGSGATLVLLNGNRMAPSSRVGDFVDLSMIPISALERIEVLTDGASSVYGGDAVAGVINFVLRDDFSGAETFLRYGTVTSGQMREVRASQSIGTAWQSGNILATYEYLDRDPLLLVDRPFIIPPRRANNTELPVLDRFNLQPSQRRHSAVIAGNQNFGSRLSLSGAALYTERQSEAARSSPANTGGFGVVNAMTDSLSVAASLDYQLTSSWFTTLDVTYNKLNNESEQRVCGEVFCERGANVPIGFAAGDSDLWAADWKVDGVLMNLPAGEVKAAFGSHFRRESFTQRSGSNLSSSGDRDVEAVYAELVIPIIDTGNAVTWARRLILNLSGRIENYSDFGSTADPKIGVLWAPTNDLSFRASYGTSFSPPVLGRSGALDRGATVLPYSVLLSNLGFDLPDPSLADVDFMATFGTDDGLEPETAESFTTGFDYSYRATNHSLSIAGSYYAISFEGRLGNTPMPGNVNPNFAPHIALQNPELLPPDTVIFFPNPQQIQTIADSLARPITFNNGGTLDNVGIVNRALIVRNLASVDTSGIDFQLNYTRGMGAWDLLAGLNVNHIIDFEQRAAPNTPSVSTLNTQFNPTDTRLRGYVGFSEGRVSGRAIVNYTNRYSVDSTPNSEAIAAWTTADAYLSYRFDASAGVLSGVTVNASMLNVFDQRPPRTPVFGNFFLPSYDPTNASAVGRFVALEVRKTF